MTKRFAAWRGRGPLQPLELAEAAVLADVAVALIVFGWLLPATTVFILLATLPMAAVAARNRPRAVVAGGIAGTTIGMLIAGTALASNVASVAVIGALLGVGWRRRWGMTRLVAVAVALFWPPAAIGADLVLLLFARLRTLALAQVTNTWAGVKANLIDIGLSDLARRVDPAVRWAVTHWAVGVPASLLTGIVVGAVLGRLLVWGALDRLERIRPTGPAADPSLTSPPEARAPGTAVRGSVADGAGGGADRRSVAGGGAEVPRPVPVRLREVGFSYPRVDEPALRAVSLAVEPGEFVAVVGPNGSGKSTLVRILGGQPPSTGVVDRPGAVGRGRERGTAMIFQRPESQVLGVRVRDDLIWGLPRQHRVDVGALLHRVGLDGFAGRETSTLSGGELQRLAVASALARRPSLLISDEATAMVDAQGRALLVDLLAGLATDEGMAVVHVTHRLEEARRAGRTLFLDRGRLGSRPEPAGAWAAESVAQLRAHFPTAGEPVLELAGVGHVYSAATPWAHRALEGVDLALCSGEAVMVLGRNGSGKSTLAWVLAGLLEPSEGSARLDGRPVGRQLGRVALSFQHARLQLLRRTVRADVRAAGQVDDDGADAALRLVGLDPSEVGARSVDQLSGGQQRRVVLAGMLARRPRVLVLDEPFAGLDDGARRGLVGVLGRLRVEAGLTLVLVTHDTEGSAELVDRVLTLEQGRVVDDRPSPGAAPATSSPAGSH